MTAWLSLQQHRQWYQPVAICTLAPWPSICIGRRAFDGVRSIFKLVLVFGRLLVNATPDVLGTIGALQGGPAF